VWALSDEEQETQPRAALPLEPVTDEQLEQFLTNRDVPSEEVLHPFSADDEVTAFAQQAARGAASAHEKIQALSDAIRQHLTQGRELYVSIAPRTGPPMLPAATLRQLREESAFTFYSLELAGLLVAASRAAGVPALLAEIYQFDGAQRPADPSGTMGYYVAALPQGNGAGSASFYDPASGRFGDNARGEGEVLDDGAAVAAYWGGQALHEAANAGDATRGDQLASLAVRLRPQSPTARAARGTVRLIGGGGELSARAALEEYEQALRRRPDPQRKLLVARILLAMQQLPRAEELVRSALTDTPEFAAAHGLLGLLHAAQRSFDEAQASLSTAEQLEPRDPHLALLWVQYHVAQHDLTAAADAAAAVVDRVPNDPQPRLMLGQVLYQDARYEAANEQFAELLRQNPSNGHLRQVLSEMFGYDGDSSDEEEDTEVALAQAETAEGDAGAELADASGDEEEEEYGGGFQLKMGQGLGKVRLGGPQGFQLAPVSP
jgi:cytochrome c-type biogenesis protein CcmH/NrfG